ncbi:MAG: hypothetical protein AUG53_14605 [Delftia sp. 13_1_20CM_4_67_18]|nr:MAG: hypothetical protein AUG53_14605 [Delftia sp. 13_1_20CM_4_67_18]
MPLVFIGVRQAFVFVKIFKAIELVDSLIEAHLIFAGALDSKSKSMRLISEFALPPSAAGIRLYKEG